MTQFLPAITENDILSPLNGDTSFGSLSTARGNLPLEALDVQARIDGLIAGVRMRQEFLNCYSEPLEATYIFPLPDRSAVTSFQMQVGDRLIQGILKERGKARREYRAAIEAGHHAAITEEERPGVFTLRVGNILPGERAVVHLTLAGPLPYSYGEATFRFPLVVAPRYIPGAPLPGESVGAGVAPDTDAVPDASRITPPVLLPGFPNPVRLSLLVEVDPSGMDLGDFRSSLHSVVTETGEDGQIKIRLEPGERINRDFILRFRAAENAVKTALVLQADAGLSAPVQAGKEEEGGTFLLTVVPPQEERGARKPREVVFILDRSGSMGGWKMVAARRAMARMVDTLREDDRFTVFAFDNIIEIPPEFPKEKLLEATDRNRYRAIEFLSRIDARGGTEMASPLRKAVEILGEEDPRKDRILILVTDGQVGGEDQILRAIGSRLSNIRVFTLGIDRAVNEGFLNRLAQAGGGSCEMVESEDRLDEVMDQVHRRIGTPLITDLKIEADGLTIQRDSIVPGRLPDLFPGAPLFIFGRCLGSLEGMITLKGSTGEGKPWSTGISALTGDHPELPKLWARGHLRELEDRHVTARENREELERSIVDISLRFGVLCRFTAYVAVDESEVANRGGKLHQVIQPVEEPEGWAMAPVPMGPEAMELGAMDHAIMPRVGRRARLSSLKNYFVAPPKDIAYCREQAAQLAEHITDRLPGKSKDLKWLLKELRKLIKALRTVNEPAEPIELLFTDLEELLTEGIPGVEEIAKFLQRAEKVLSEFALGSSSGSSQPKTPRPRREDFWK